MAERIKPAAAVGFARGADAYSRARPGYPASVADRLADCLEPIVDLAAGTGKLTDALVEVGRAPIVVEPVDAMLASLLQRHRLPAIRALAEQLPFRSSAAGAIVVGQAFHWFECDRALEEALRVLIPGGVLALVFNERDESVPWVARFTEICVRHGGGRPYTPHDERSWPDLLSAAGFVDVEELHVDNPVETDAAGLVDRAASTSYVSALAAEPRAEALDEVRTLATTHPALVGRDRFVFPHSTQLVLGHCPTGSAQR